MDSAHRTWDVCSRKFTEMSNKLSYMRKQQQMECRNVGISILKSEAGVLKKLDIDKSFEFSTEDVDGAVVLDAWLSTDPMKKASWDVKVVKNLQKQPLLAFMDSQSRVSLSDGIGSQVRRFLHLQSNFESNGKTSIDRTKSIPVGSDQAITVNSKIYSISSDSGVQVRVKRTSLMLNKNFLVQNIVFGNPDESKLIMNVSYSQSVDVPGTVSRIISPSIPCAAFTTPNRLSLGKTTDDWRDSNKRSIALCYAMFKALKAAESGSTAGSLFSKLRKDVSVMDSEPCISLDCPGLKMILFRNTKDDVFPSAVLMREAMPSLQSSPGADLDPVYTEPPGKTWKKIPATPPVIPPVKAPTEKVITSEVANAMPELDSESAKGLIQAVSSNFVDMSIARFLERESTNVKM